MAGGILQIRKGLNQMSGSGVGAETDRLLAASDAAVDEGNTFLAEAYPVFKAALEAIDSEGLAAVRSQRTAEIRKAAGQFRQTAERLQAAAAKASEAAARGDAEKVRPFLEAKGRSYRHGAEAKLLNAEICGMMTDEAIPTVEALTPKLLEAAKRRDEAEAKAAAATAEARQLSGELNP